MSLRDLAREVGIGYGHVRGIACGSKTSRRGRAKIEAYLKETFWPVQNRKTDCEGGCADPCDRAEPPLSESQERRE
jgi:hypothetical protein